MSWLKVDDAYDTNPKLIELTEVQRWRWTRVLLYCARHRTVGRISRNALAELGLARAIDLLVRIGLLTATDDGYQINDWQFYNGATVDERVAAYLEKYPGASANEVHREIGGKREAVIAAYRNHPAGTQPVPGNHPAGTQPVPKSVPLAGARAALTQEVLKTFERPTTVDTVDNFLVFAGNVGLTTTQRDEAMQLPVHLIDEAVRRTERFHPENQAAYFCAVVRDFAAVRESKVAPLEERLESFARNVRHALTDDELELELREKGADDALVARLLSITEEAA